MANAVNTAAINGGHILKPPIENYTARTDRILFGVKEAAAALSVSRSYIYELFRSGHLKFLKVGGRRLIEAAEIHALVERLKTSQAKAV